ncbi:MAG: hypothetical protein ACOH17_08245 [Cellulomonas sp.]
MLDTDQHRDGEPDHTDDTAVRRAPSRIRERVLRFTNVSIPYAVSAAVTLLVALWTYRPWKFKGAIASLWGDPLAFHSWVQAIIENGWYENASRLAAPYGQNSHTYTVTDEFLFAVIGKVLAPLTGSAGAAVTWWVVLCFPLAAIFAVGAARYLGVGRATALIPGIAFPLIPDHFLRAGGHFSLSSIWAISLGMIVILSLARQPRLTGRRRVWFEVWMLTACAIISLTNAYYAIFIVILVAVAGVGGAVAHRSWRVLASGVARGLALVVPIFVAMLIDRADSPHPLGYASVDVTRSPSDAELYGGKIFAMLLPSPSHRFPIMRAIRNHYDTTFPNPAETPALGLVAAVGFLGLGTWAILAYFRRRPELADPRLRTLAGLLWVAVLAYAVGGLGSAWSFLLDGGGIRVWSRMHVVIALIALLAVAVALDRLRGRYLRVGIVVVVLGVVLVDQTTPYARIDPVAPLAMRTEVTTFTAAVAADAPPQAMVFQLPEVNFPAPQRLVDPASIYDGFLPYLYSTGLRWSYGGLEGDPHADWQLGLTARPFTEQAPLLAAAGFSGVVVDTRALVSLPDLETQVRSTLGLPEVVSSSGRWEYFELPPALLEGCSASAVSELHDLAVAPPILYPGQGITVQPGVMTEHKGVGQLRVLTVRSTGWGRVRVDFTVDSPTTGLVAMFPDGSTRAIPAGQSAVTWSGGTTAPESFITLTRDNEGGPYQVGSLTATAIPSSAAAACLPEPAATPAG